MRERRARSALSTAIRADWKANRGMPRSQLILLGFRITRAMTLSPSRYVRTVGFVATIFYRALTEMVLGLELRPRTQVGPGLTIFHGFGLVINTHAVIGAHCVLRHGVTIGAKTNTGRSPRLEDGVVVGAGAIILGGITIGAGATIGAGSVVLEDVPAGATVAGNPATVIKAPEGD